MVGIQINKGKPKQFLAASMVLCLVLVLILPTILFVGITQSKDGFEQELRQSICYAYSQEITKETSEGKPQKSGSFSCPICAINHLLASARIANDISLIDYSHCVSLLSKSIIIPQYAALPWIGLQQHSPRAPPFSL
ncbi:MAG: hypothetical protein HWE34_16530 [Methylocystaceae bacterium]|nr:hypothetical protein [Methylocystaceae bacterium]